ncbi:LysR family transcriptional regulator [Sporosarcina pasteurii]|uniref:HTH-type transcriptional regulator gltR n=1 Tax=Sporosarcina pasteurii TaxID=1474 RepID=A0A380BXP2_SPOPA|nr:LysR family transcriptional regulator [Sporosarcina pasteurii]MDS9471415.1 LysR family transcriptional regulator [Sporosarcina pasteurii]QBQ04959.1 LysR family transcriptional regulator [Sporosarcina pasteurii]SUJ09002.1 HTH-type transcriptional regulator gltR [Sporosarcina pasteurii]
MDKVQLETFLTIAKHKSYSKAAELLNVTQPTVTARIKNLEKELVCQLFERVGRQITLTEEGSIFVEYATSILTYMNHSKEVTRSAKYPNVRIGFSPGYSYSFITEVINSVIDIDNLGITIIEGEDSVSLNEQILSGEFDLVFTRNVLSHKPELISEYLFDNRLIAALSKNHPLAEKTTLRLNDLQGQTIIGYRRHTKLWSEIEQKLIGIPNVKRIEVDNNEMLKNLVESGLGIGITPSLGINKHIDTNLVVKKIEGIDNIPNKVYVQYRKNSAIAKPIKKIIYSIINHEMEKTM